MDARYIRLLRVRIRAKQTREETDVTCLYQMWQRVCPTSEHISSILHFRLRLDVTQYRRIDYKQVVENGMAKTILLLHLCSVHPKKVLKSEEMHLKIYTVKQCWELRLESVPSARDAFKPHFQWSNRPRKWLLSSISSLLRFCVKPHKVLRQP